MNTVSFRIAVSSGIENNDWDSLDDWFVKQSSFSFREESGSCMESVTDEIIDCIRELLASSDFRNAEGSYNVLRILEYDWAIISPEQKARLLPDLANSITYLHDEISRFMIVELLGEFYCDDKALVFLLELSQSPLPEIRELVPMGLGHIIRKHPGTDLSMIALDRLKCMQSDPSAQVLREVNLVLQRR